MRTGSSKSRCRCYRDHREDRTVHEQDVRGAGLDASVGGGATGYGGRMKLTCRSMIVFACRSAACRPPGKNGGTGGSLPSGGGGPNPGDAHYIAGLAKAAGVDESWGEDVSPKLGIIEEGHPPSALKNLIKQRGAERIGHQIEGKVDWTKDIKNPEDLYDPYQYVTMSALKAKNGGRSTGSFNMEHPEISNSRLRQAFEDGTVAEFAKTYKAVTGIPLETVVVATMQQAWGGNFGGPLCREMMLSARRVLPMHGDVGQLASYWHERGSSPMSSGLVDRVMKHIYKNTQDDLKRRGVDEVTVIRGVRQSAPVGGEGQIQLRPVSSFCVSRGTASSFGGRGIQLTIPRDRILSTSSSGFGCSFEHEVLVLGGTYQAKFGSPYDLTVDG